MWYNCGGFIRATFRDQRTGINRAFFGLVQPDLLFCSMNSTSNQFMHGQFNYVLFLIRILFVLAWSALVIGLLFFLPGQLSQKHDLSGVVGVIAGFVFVFSIITVKFWRAIWTERFGLIITPDGVIVKDHLLFRSFTLRHGEIKGFSLSEYPVKIKGIQSILLYRVNGRKIEFPQFLFLNFRKITKALEESGISFLGEEPYIWKWVDSRIYKFDD